MPTDIHVVPDFSEIKEMTIGEKVEIIAYLMLEESCLKELSPKQKVIARAILKRREYERDFLPEWLNPMKW